MAEIIPGTRVRSFDFDGRDVEGERACFVEGTVVGFRELEGCTRYDIIVDRRVFGGEDCALSMDGERVFPPVNGTPRCSGASAMASSPSKGVSDGCREDSAHARGRGAHPRSR